MARKQDAHRNGAGPQRGEPPRLVVPVYLNQAILFDLLATIEDGFAQVSTLSPTAAQTGDTLGRADASAGLGLSNIFSFLGVTMHGSFKGSTTESHEGKDESKR